MGNYCELKSAPKLWNAPYHASLKYGNSQPKSPLSVPKILKAQPCFVIYIHQLIFRSSNIYVSPARPLNIEFALFAPLANKPARRLI